MPNTSLITHYLGSLSSLRVDCQQWQRAHWHISLQISAWNDENRFHFFLPLNIWPHFKRVTCWYFWLTSIDTTGTIAHTSLKYFATNRIGRYKFVMRYMYARQLILLGRYVIDNSDLLLCDFDKHRPTRKWENII